jgi:hypothetical protein
MQLTQEQTKALRQYLDDYRKAQTVEDNSEAIPYASFDEKRITATHELRKMVDGFLNGDLSLLELKEKSETTSRSFPYWGFKNFSGQMQLNQYVNNIDDSSKSERLKNALHRPATLEEAAIKINALAEYLAELKTKTDNPKSIPRVNQSFLMSYFWELQNPESYPVFFGSMKNVLENLGFDFKSQESAGDEYKYFAEI